MTEYIHKIDISKIKTYNLNVDGLNVEMSFSSEQMKEIYSDLLLIRKIENKSERLFKDGKIRGFCHLVTGQENIYAAYKHFSEKGDTCSTSYRCHGLALMAGNITPREILAELMGRKDGICGGRGGSMHLYNSQFYGGHGIVGAPVPIAVGTAFKHKYVNLKKGDTFEQMNGKNVAFTFYGDGAANQGQIYEVFNIAGILKLPIVFICENNHYGMWTPVNRVSYETSFYKRGQKLPGICICHDNIFDIIGVLKFARKYVLKKEPIVIEIQTTRLCGHSTKDDEDTRREISDERSKDVIPKYREFLSGFVSVSEILKIEDEVTQRVERDLKYAHNSPFPDEADLYNNVLED